MTLFSRDAKGEAGAVLTDPRARRKVRAAALCLAIAALLVVLAALEAQEAMKAAWVRSWKIEAEQLGAFARTAIASGNELLLVEQLGAMTRRDEVAYAVLIDSQGLVRYADTPANAGKRLAGPRSKAALEAKAAFTVLIPETGMIEVAVPVGSFALRCGFTTRHLAGASRMLVIAAVLAVLGLGGAGLLVLRLS